MTAEIVNASPHISYTVEVTLSRSPQRMGLRIQHPLIQTHQAPTLTKDKIEILERLRRPEGLHAVDFLGMRGGDIVDGGVGDGRAGVVVDAAEDVPSVVLEGGVAGDAVEDED